jgi:branched-chain amino acid aminotransferase
MNFICFNGKILSASEPVLMADNKSYRYGDGLFETIKVINGKICLESYHFKRFFSSLQLLQMVLPALLTAEKLREQVFQLCEKNKCIGLARIRLSVFRGNGGIFEGSDELQYLIECWPVNESVNRLNENGLVIDIYPDAKKSCDHFSNIKSANFLPYVMAARYAKQNKWNDCLVLNVNDGVADSTIANVFLVKGEKLITPALSEGCINGVMRRYLLEELKEADFEMKVEEGFVTVDDLHSADEVFLTNAIQGIKWVARFRDKKYTSVVTEKIYSRFIQTIFK